MMPAKGLVVLLSLLLVLSVTCAEEREVTSSSSPGESQVQCANDLIKWCKDMDQNNTVSLTYTNLFSHNNSFQILCVRDNSGANCSKNGEIWFSCSPERALTYKGRQLVEGSAEGADDDICNADDLLNGMGMGFNQTAFDESMRRFREGMQIFEESMRKMQERLSAQFAGLGNRMFGNFWPFQRGGNPMIGYGDDDDYDDM